MNNLFTEVLEGRIPLPRRQPRRRYYWLPAGSFDPAAPTMNDLAEAVEITALTIDGYSPIPWPHMAPSKDWDEPDHTKPAPIPPWAGNLATQKRRKRL